MLSEADARGERLAALAAEMARLQRLVSGEQELEPVGDLLGQPELVCPDEPGEFARRLGEVQDLTFVADFPSADGDPVQECLDLGVGERVALEHRGVPHVFWQRSLKPPDRALDRESRNIPEHRGPVPGEPKSGQHRLARRHDRTSSGPRVTGTGRKPRLRSNDTGTAGPATSARAAGLGPSGL